MSTPADTLRAAAAKLRPSSPTVAAHTVSVRLSPPVVDAAADLLEALSYADDSEPGRHDACDRTVCAEAAALALARAILSGPPKQGPLTGIEVRDPCPLCRRLIPRSRLARHIRDTHTEGRQEANR